MLKRTKCSETMKIIFWLLTFALFQLQLLAEFVKTHPESMNKSELQQKMRFVLLVLGPEGKIMMPLHAAVFLVTVSTSSSLIVYHTLDTHTRFIIQGHDACLALVVNFQIGKYSVIRNFAFVGTLLWLRPHARID